MKRWIDYNEIVTQKDVLEIPFSGKKEEEKKEPVIEPVKRKFRLPIGAAAGFLCAVCAVGFIIYLNGRVEEVNLLSGIQPSFAGYSGRGYVEGEFHPEQAGMDALEECRSDWQSSEERTAAYDALLASISCSFSKSEGLQNGEQITYSCTYDAASADEAHVRIGTTERKYTVSGLAEYQVINVFRDISAVWNVSSEGIVLDVSIPQDLKDLGIEYTWEYISSETPVIRFIASYDEEKLREAGYVAEAGTMDYPIDKKPVRLNDPSQLSTAEKEAVTINLRNLLESELEQCGSLHLGQQEIHVTDISLRSFSATIGSYFDPDNVQFMAVFRLDTDYRGGLISYSAFEASYRAVIYRLADGSVSYYPITKHGCEFRGIFGRYSLEETGN